MFPGHTSSCLGPCLPTVGWKPHSVHVPVWLRSCAGRWEQAQEILIASTPGNPCCYIKSVAFCWFDCFAFSSDPLCLLVCCVISVLLTHPVLPVDSYASPETKGAVGQSKTDIHFAAEVTPDACDDDEWLRQRVKKRHREAAQTFPLFCLIHFTITSYR